MQDTNLKLAKLMMKKYPSIAPAIKKQYGLSTKQATTKSGQAIPAPTPKPGSFTENERAALLRGVIDALDLRGEQFKVWRKHGLSRIYFADGSWLSYSPAGVAIYGPDKEGEAYRVRTELGLKAIAKRAVVL